MPRHASPNGRPWLETVTFWTERDVLCKTGGVSSPITSGGG